MRAKTTTKVPVPFVVVSYAGPLDWLQGAVPQEARRLSGGFLLSYAVDVAAAEDDLLGLNADALVDALAPDLVVDLLERVDGQLVVLVAVLRDDNAVVGDR